jgi:hypothetical protein
MSRPIRQHRENKKWKREQNASPYPQQQQQSNVVPSVLPLQQPDVVPLVISDADIFDVQDRTLQRVDPYPLCAQWTQRPVELLFKDSNDPFGVGHLYALFHSLLNFPPINTDNDKELQRASQSPYENLELWQRGARFDLVYAVNKTPRLRIFIASKKLTQPSGEFPSTNKEKNYPILLDEDRMNFNVLCIFLSNKIAEVKKKGVEM